MAFSFEDLKDRPNVTVEQPTSNEIVKLIRKLPWIGMEDEADDPWPTSCTNHVLAE